jgi:hypothetical protein
MFNDSAKPLTDLTRPFLQPQNSTHRQYEALRAYFVERLPSAEAARRGGYTAGSFRVLVHQFRQNPDRQFFLPAAKGLKTAPKADRLREKVIALRKQNLSIYDISRILGGEVEPLSPVAVSRILKQEGFARLPRRQDEERPPTIHPDAAAVANVAALGPELTPVPHSLWRLVLFLPTLVPAHLDHLGLAGQTEEASQDHAVHLPDGKIPVRHPPQSGRLDELGRLKGGRAMGLGVARCAP